jgi:hypothetical protein
LVRGADLHFVSGVRFEPSDGIVVGTPQEAADGRSLTVEISIAADALLGDRALVVETASGSSPSVLEGANRFIVADQVIGILDTLAAPAVGVLVGTDDEPEPPVLVTEHAATLGVVLGPYATGSSPDRGTIGTQVDLTIQGSGLDAVTELSLVPPDGILVTDLVADPLGETVTAVLDIAADAPTTWRGLRLRAGTAEIPFTDPSVAGILVTALPPEIHAVAPNTLQVGASATLTLYGVNLERASEVRALPPGGLSIGAPQVAADGRSLTIAVSAEAGAPVGPRTLVVTTAGGDSALAASPQNTLTLYQDVLAAPEDLTAPLLGVVVGEEQPPSESRNVELHAPRLGVVVAVPETPAERPVQMLAPAVGAIVGPYVESIAAPALLAGGTYELTLSGSGLGAVDAATLSPDTDLVPGTPVPSADGASVTVSLTVSADATGEPRELTLWASGVRVPFLDPAVSRIYTARGVPEITYLSPITGRPGDRLELLVSGQYLENATRVVAEPAEGVLFAPSLSVNAEGTELRIELNLSYDAPTGERTIRVETPGGSSTSQPSSANTFIVF